MKTYKAMYKNEIARAAGVSSRVFTRWCASHRGALRLMGVAPSDKLLPPSAVRYLCEFYCISLDED